MTDHFVDLDLIKTPNSSTAGASDQTLAGPAQAPGPAPETAATPMSQATQADTFSPSATTRSMERPPAFSIESGTAAILPVAPKSEASTALVARGTQAEAPAVAPGTVSGGSGSAPTGMPTPRLPSQAQPGTGTSISAPPAVAAAFLRSEVVAGSGVLAPTPPEVYGTPQALQASQPETPAVAPGTASGGNGSAPTGVPNLKPPSRLNPQPLPVLVFLWTWVSRLGHMVPRHKS